MLATRAAQATATTDCLRAALTAQTADARADALSQLRRHLAAGGLLRLDAGSSRPPQPLQQHLGWGGGVPPLHAAARCGNEPVVALLLEHGAAAGALDASRRSALHLAAQRGCGPVSVQLLLAGAAVDATDVEGFTVRTHPRHYTHVRPLL
jgi:hypothetical protein